MKDLESNYLKFLHERPKTLWGRTIFLFLKGLSLLFLMAWWLRRVSYNSGLRPRKRLACPVVSIGNLTTGGTGKTPIVISLARHFSQEGKKVAVLSRGYGRRPKTSKVVWVSDGERLLAGPEEGGDEPVLIAKSVPRAAVVVCSDRHKAGEEVVERFKPDLFILDDGFQRRFGLHRDLDILVVDGLNPFSTGWVLPAGLLREPLNTLAEANVLILNKVNQAHNPEDIRTVLRRHNPRAYLVESGYKPILLREFKTSKEIQPSSLDRLSVGAFSGIANPSSFIHTLAEYKVLVRHAYDLGDHFDYDREKMRRIMEDAKKRGLERLVTTQKDEVKLPSSMDFPIPILVLEVRWEVMGGKAHWETVLRNISLACS